MVQWGGRRCLSQQGQQHHHQQHTQHQHQEQRRQGQLEVAARAGVQGGGAVNHMGGGCPSCGGKGPDGVWRDEEGRRLYTEQEVRRRGSKIQVKEADLSRPDTSSRA